jgi:hypothetical protein
MEGSKVERLVFFRVEDGESRRRTRAGGGVV